jgi:hypothetical protein
MIILIQHLHELIQCLQVVEKRRAIRILGKSSSNTNFVNAICEMVHCFSTFQFYENIYIAGKYDVFKILFF